MTLFFIRHPCHSVLPFICYSLLYAASWIFVIPAVARVNTATYETYIEAKTRDMPSSGYFRRNKDNILYYSTVNEDTNAVSGLCIDTSLSENNVYTFSSLTLAHKKNAFTDSLIQNSIAMPPSIAITVQKVLELSVILKKCAARSFGYWLCFASMGLALLGVLGVRHVSQWRLVNVLLVVGITVGIIVGNTFGYVNPLVVGIENSFNDLFAKIGIFKHIAEIGNPFIILCNIFVFIILLVLFFVFEKNSRELESI